MPSTTGNIEGLTEEYKGCMKELAQWFVEHKRKMCVEDMRPIAEKYFGSGEELTEFYNYLSSDEGNAEFGKIMRLAAWKAGISGPER